MKNAGFVLDPMCGSGTTLVEARLLGRDSLGIDIDPLARLLTRVKVTALDEFELLSAKKSLIENLAEDFAPGPCAQGSSALKGAPAVALPEYLDKDWVTYWFLRPVASELSLVKRRIDEEKDQALREFFYVCFSSIILTKGSSGVSCARDLAHSRPHRVLPARKPNVLKIFMERLESMTKRMIEYNKACHKEVMAEIIGQDARHIPLADQSVDLIVTSPPYATAIDYLRAHKFSLYWLGFDPNILSIFERQGYIGTEKVPKEDCQRRLETPLGHPVADRTLRQIAEKDVKRAGILHKYFEDMRLVIGEMYRVLKKRKYCWIVIGDPSAKQVRIPTTRILINFAKSSGFDCIHILPRRLDRDKRQLPTNHVGPNKGIENRIFREDVVILRK